MIIKLIFFLNSDHTLWFQVYDILEKAKLYGWKIRHQSSELSGIEKGLRRAKMKEFF